MDAKQALDKIQHFFMILSLRKNRYRRTKWRPQGKNKSISPKIRNKMSMFTITSPVQQSAWNISQYNYERERNKRDSYRKERIQIVIMCDDLVLSIEDPRNFTKITLRINNQFQQSSRTQIHTRASSKNQTKYFVHRKHERWVEVVLRISQI